MKLLLAALFITGFVSANDYQILYESYKLNYKDSYLSSKYSLEAFTLNIKNIEYHNSNQQFLHTLGINQFTGVSHDELLR